MNVIERHVGMFSLCARGTVFTFKFISLSVLVAIAAIALVANAQEDEATTSDEVIIENQTDEQQAFVEEASPTEQENQPPASQSVLNESSQERIINLAANISNRMDAMIERFENIVVRTEERIGKMQREGYDTSAAEVRLLEAQNMIAAARVPLSDIDNEIVGFVSSVAPKAMWAEVKFLYESAESELTSAHKELSATIEALRGATKDLPSTEIETENVSTSTASSTL